MRDIFTLYMQAAQERKTTLEALEAEKVSDRTSPFRLNEINAEIPALLEQTERAKMKYQADIQAVKESYIQAVNEYSVVKGSDLTDDAKLFDSPLDIGKDNLTKLAETYWQNFTMSKLIVDYAKNKNIFIAHAPTAETKINHFEEICKMFNPVGEGVDSYSARYLSDTEKYKEFISKFDGVIGNGEELPIQKNEATESNNNPFDSQEFRDFQTKLDRIIEHQKKMRESSGQAEPQAEL